MNDMKGITETKTQIELQIRGGIEDNSKIIFSFLNKNICCDPSLEPSQQDGSNEGSQNMLLWRNKANYPSYPFLSGALNQRPTKFESFNNQLCEPDQPLR